MINERKREYRKLHILLPEELFQEIRNRGMLGQIDSVVIHLLKGYMEENP